MGDANPLRNLSFKDALLFNPYDNNRRPKSLDGFDFKSIRVIPQSFIDEKKNLQEVIDPEGNFNRQFFIISGYSGNGKTTFLHWFKEEIEKENYWFNITNLIEHAHGIDDDFKLVQKSIIHKFKQTLLKKKTLEFILANRVIFRDFFKPELIGKIFDLKNHHNYDIEKTLYLFDELDFKQILILFVLDYIFDFIDDKQYTNCKSFTFCFDNLDELRFEYITPKMWSAILDLSSNMRYIIQNTDLNFDYRKVIFILVFREANIACGIAALNDRLSPEVRNKRFIFTTIAKEIIGRRINLVTRYLDENDKRLKFLLETIKEERILDYILMPLFNYDYRKLCEAAV